MEITLKLLGVFTYISIGSIIVGFVWAYAMDATKSLIMEFVNEVKEKTRKQIAQELRRDAWWFSEDNNSMEAINSIADLVELQRDISDCRETWRKKKK